MRNSLWVLFVAITFTFSGCLDRNIVDSATQMRIDLETIDNYLAQKNINAIKDKSGVRYTIEQLGTGGFPPRVDQQVNVNYSGRFLDGTVFDPGGDATGVLNSFILGWQVALSVWPAGTKATLYVPSPLAYGNDTHNSIPPNSILTFTVYLKEVVLSNAEKARFTADVTTIDTYLSDHQINAVQDSTGIRYVITNPGNDQKPGWYTKVKFTYTGKLLANGNQFFTGSTGPNDNFDSRVVDYIDALRFGLQKIGVGGKITVYVPSGRAFGPSENPQTSVPANSNVIYEIQLDEIVP